MTIFLDTRDARGQIANLFEMRLDNAAAYTLHKLGTIKI